MIGRHEIQSGTAVQAVAANDSNPFIKERARDNFVRAQAHRLQKKVRRFDNPSAVYLNKAEQIPEAANNPRGMKKLLANSV
jgi:hypothetical protein